MNPKTEKLPIRKNKIARRVKRLARAINSNYRKNFLQKPLVLLCILKGAYIFTADLSRHLKIPHEAEFLRAECYQGKKPRKKVKLVPVGALPVKGRDILVVDGIMDTGRTLKSVLDWLGKKRPKSVKICVLLKKRVKNQISLKIDFIGFNISNVFVVGYGMDCDGIGREKKDIIALT